MNDAQAKSRETGYLPEASLEGEGVTNVGWEPCVESVSPHIFHSLLKKDVPDGMY